MEESDSLVAAIGVNDGRCAVSSRGAVTVVELAGAAGLGGLVVTEIRSLLGQFKQWAKSPDLYAVALLSGAASADVRRADAEVIAAHAALVWRVDCFPKPTVALLSEPVTGATASMMAVATHRVGARGFRFAVPPLVPITGLPLAGVAHMLAQLPDSVGTYLAMTGVVIGAADALEIGLLTHAIPQAAFTNIIAALADSQPVDPLLDHYESETEAPELAPHRRAIARCFSKPSLPAIRAALAAESGADAEWARCTAEALDRQSPQTLAIIHRLVTDAATLDLRDSLILSCRVATRLHASTASYDLPLDQLFLSDQNTDIVLPSRADIAIGRF